MERLNSIFKLFLPEQKVRPASQPSKHLRLETVYGAAPRATASKNTLWNNVAPAVPAANVLARQKEMLSKQGRYSSIEEVKLSKNTLLVGFSDPQNFVFMFSFNIYYAAKEWEGLKKQAASRKAGIVCYQPKQDEVVCLQLIKPGQSKVCSYLLHSNALEVNPTRGWLVLPQEKNIVCTPDRNLRLR